MSSLVKLPDAEDQQILNTLTTSIRQYHMQVERNGEALVESMVRCGQLMLKAKLMVPKGEWGKYVSDVLGIHRKTAGTYIRFATYAEELRVHNPTTIHHARQILNRLGVPSVNDVSENKVEARKMKKRGMTYQEIANHFGVPKSTISYWLNAERLNANKRKHSKLATKAKRMQEAERLKRAMREAKDTDLSEAYSYVRKALEALQRAQKLNENDLRETKDHMSKAMSALYRAEDDIIAASKSRYLEEV